MDYENKLREALDSEETDYDVVRWIESTFPELAESEDERIRKALIELVGLTPDYMFGEIKPNKFIAYLEKQKEQKPDDDPLDDPKFIKGFDTGREVQRIFDEKKPAEWSEEDEKMLKVVQDLIYGIELSAQTEFGYKQAVACLEWLNSLRPSWKPSKKQMDALAWYSGNSAIPPTGDKAIQSLYNDLKKLM